MLSKILLYNYINIIITYYVIYDDNDDDDDVLSIKQDIVTIINITFSCVL